MAPPRLAALGLTAAGVDALGLYAALLAMVDARGLVAGHVTVGLVQELAQLVHPKSNRWDIVPQSKLAVKEFCHVVAYMAARLEVAGVKDKVRRSMWVPNVLNQQFEEMGQEKLWPGLVHLPGFDSSAVAVQDGEVGGAQGVETRNEVQAPAAALSATLAKPRVFKIIVVGESGVGKTCLSYRFCSGKFPLVTEATIGLDFREKLVELYGERLQLQLWDTAGQERIKRSITHHYYRNVSAVVFVYDVTNAASLGALDSWLAEVRRHGVPEAAPRVLVGNKSDQVGEKTS